ncbi:MAG: flagellar hook-associated protein 3 [Lachnospiraceae bacterium]|nr:flagellar hook-associated protein 3 [Lachnospiraceae bacterium]
MRITNKMMTNNVLTNINGNKNALSKLEQQYSTGLKISKPSEDPIIAVRALKLRTNLNELNQYYEKNIPDALSWMDVSESALGTINEILTQVHTLCVQGASDTLTTDDRNAILANLKQYKEQIYQEGSSNYAGRYVFTGYKTDTSLVFDEATTNLDYNITENLSGSNISIMSKTINSFDMENYDPANPTATDFDDQPITVTAYRMQLSYADLKSEDEDGTISIRFPVRNDSGEIERDDDGNIVYDDYTGDITMTTSVDAEAYQPDPGSVKFLADTGELIIGEDVYAEWRDLSDISVSYDKSSFSKNDLRPEHYFDCTVTDMTTEDAEPVVYTKEDQQIQYEINFNQSITVNTQGSDAIKHEIGRAIDDMMNAISAVVDVETKISDTEKMLEDGNLTNDQKTALNQILEVLKIEQKLKTEEMQTKFENGITRIAAQQDVVSVAAADLGSRYNRVELTESRLSTEQTQFEELLSQNEDADLVNTIINMQSQETIYNASLNAASKVVKNSLLDFI